MRQHLNLYEAVRTERNLYSKNLVESQDETDEMKRKFKVMNHLVEQLKEELISKDNALIKEHFDYLKVFPVFPNSVKLLATLVLPGIQNILWKQRKHQGFHVGSLDKHGNVFQYL
jgi:hypothetical protein